MLGTLPLIRVGITPAAETAIAVSMRVDRLRIRLWFRHGCPQLPCPPENNGAG